VIIYLICNKGRPISMIGSGQEPEEFTKRMGNKGTIIILTQKDVESIIKLNEGE